MKKSIILLLLTGLLLCAAPSMAADEPSAKLLTIERAVIISQDEIALKFSEPITLKAGVDSAPHMRLLGDGALMSNFDENRQLIHPWIKSEQMQAYSRNKRIYENDASVLIVKYSNEDKSDTMTTDIVRSYNLGFDMIVWMHGKDAYVSAADPNKVLLQDNSPYAEIDFKYLEKLANGTDKNPLYEMPEIGSSY